jgi:hypothetical protein
LAVIDAHVSVGVKEAESGAALTDATDGERPSEVDGPLGCGES